MQVRITANFGAAVALVLAEAAFGACAQGIENAAPPLGFGAPPVGVGGAGPAGPTPGTGGSGDTSAGSGGVGATGGSGGASAGGTSSGGTQDAGGGTAGSGAGGAAGTNGGAAGVAGTAGSGGNGGAAGPGGAAGSAGNGGSAGVGGNTGATGTAGSAGNVGAAGSGGNAGSGGAGGVDAGVDTGIVDAGVDQNQPVHPVCAVGACKLVFVSSNAIDGNQAGVAGMDAVCQARAVARNLAGTWRAWASQPNNSVAMRFTQATVPYRLLDGSTIANNWNDLIDGVLAHPINVLDDGTVAASPLQVWTGTMINGAVSNSCNGWTSNGQGLTGIFGRTDLADTGWTFFQDQFCNLNLRVYCFEQ